MQHHEIDDIDSTVYALNKFDINDNNEDEDDDEEMTEEKEQESKLHYGIDLLLVIGFRQKISIRS